MESNITVLNFDQTYYKQDFSQKDTYEWLDLESIPNANLFCEKHSLVQIENKLKKRKPSNITMLGSGNYHYVSYLLLSEIKRPITLVLFDHHTDTLPSPSQELISCGSWVLESLQNIPMLQKVILIGIDESGKRYIPSSIDDKVSIYTTSLLQQHSPKIIDSLINEIPTELVYISIDKDVLDVKDAITAWDQGRMRLRQLMGIVKRIISNKEIYGMDICGEYPVNPSNEYSRQTRVAIKKNSDANQFILQQMKRWLGFNRNSGTYLHV
ncbi:hypothetical protein CWR48_08160 [Oceanobacillus arenosus]|uniref:Arginase n=1 Tax=Oceanobacillus arenosus TaxID=1229153 RepID=A0A3D8PSB3_9BACI|nr:arginase family protein [Oceanobacillus arenosus]RDW19013.1 hypothetical protein CWR48_08160 [Oceanobacillus arenosus]